jgi:hypothetical protein
MPSTSTISGHTVQCIGLIDGVLHICRRHSANEGQKQRHRVGSLFTLYPLWIKNRSSTKWVTPSTANLPIFVTRNRSGEEVDSAADEALIGIFISSSPGSNSTIPEAAFHELMKNPGNSKRGCYTAQRRYDKKGSDTGKAEQIKGVTNHNDKRPVYQIQAVTHLSADSDRLEDSASVYGVVPFLQDDDQEGE